MNHIVNESSQKIKILARSVLKGNWKVVSATFGLYAFLIFFVPSICAEVLPQTRIYLFKAQQELWPQGFPVSVVFMLYTILLTGAFTLGLKIYLLSFVRKKDINTGYIFSGFDCYFKATLMYILKSVIVRLWTILFVFPGVIATYRYYQCFYILADDPEKGTIQCLNESKHLMKGNKMKLFSLHVSFIGWLFVANIPLAIYSSYAAQTSTVGGLTSAGIETTNPVLNLLITFLLIIPQFFVIAYMAAAETVFYDLATGHLREVSRRDMETILAKSKFEQMKSEDEEDYDDSDDDEGYGESDDEKDYDDSDDDEGYGESDDESADDGERIE